MEVHIESVALGFGYFSFGDVFIDPKGMLKLYTFN